tara:strand:+ start:1349 stop:1762 length:414 start_codon:yes stop_codon:yes gene_type:complete
MPAYTIAVDEEGTESLGEAIPDGTYKQRIACNYLTQYPIFDKDRCERICSQEPVEYNPSNSDSIGRPITLNASLTGRTFYKINIVKVDGFDEDLLVAKQAFEAATDKVLAYPEGRAISPLEYEKYFSADLNSWSIYD